MHVYKLLIINKFILARVTATYCIHHLQRVKILVRVVIYLSGQKHRKPKRRQEKRGKDEREYYTRRAIIQSNECVLQNSGRRKSSVWRSQKISRALL